MRTRLLTISLLGFAVLVGSNVWAQRQGGETGSSREDIEEIAGQGEAMVKEDIESMSGQEKLDRAQTKIKKSRKNLEETNTLLKKAREDEKDIQKINCINDKLAAVKGFVKVAEQSYGKLKDAVDNDDTEEANHHYTLISVSRQKVIRLTEEARLCVGEAQRYAEGTRVDVDIDEDISEPEKDRQRWADRTTPQPGEMEGLPSLPTDEALTPFQ